MGGFFCANGDGESGSAVGEVCNMSMGTEKVALLLGRCAIYETIQDNK